MNGKRACGTTSDREKQMTSGASRLVRPGTVGRGAQPKSAARQYCQVARAGYDTSSRCVDFRRAAGRPARERPYKGSSRVKGNFHARFLGGRGRVNRLRLPSHTHRLCLCIVHQKAVAGVTRSAKTKPQQCRSSKHSLVPFSSVSSNRVPRPGFWLGRTRFCPRLSGRMCF